MTNLIPCSVQVLTRNSEATIRQCLESLRSFAEVIVHDGHSTDRTIEIARSFANVKIMEQDKTLLDDEGRIKDFSGIRNASINAATYDWVLVVDADEEIRTDLIEEIQSIIQSDQKGVFTAFRRFYVDGQKIDFCSAYPALQIRFFHRSKVEGYQKPIHERLKLAEGVTTAMLHSELILPLPPASILRAKYQRYLMMEVKRSSNLTFFGWCKWILFRNLKSSLALTLRILWIWFIPRKGNRLPLRYEFQFIQHSLRTIVHTFPPLNYFRKLPLSVRQFLVYLVSGGTATVLNFGSYLIMIHTGVWYLTAQVISEVLGFFSAFLLHKYIVFQKKDKSTEHFIRYCFLGVFNLLMSTLVVYSCVHFLHIREDLSKIISIGCLMLWNFFLYKFLVYV